MTGTIRALLLATVVSLPKAAAAQELVWLQIEARNTVAGAQAAARTYASDLDNVVGFALQTGLYGIALGPYSRADAVALSEQLKAQGQIPPDAYIVSLDAYGQQFYPVGTGVALEAQSLPDGVTPGTQEADIPSPEDLAADLAATLGASVGASVGAPEEPPAAPAPEAVSAPAEPPPPEETRTEALASENLLTQTEKEQLQIALQWAGYYNSAIDGLYGRGTRGAMAQWQEAKGYDATGVMTTRQRTELLNDYNAILEGMELAQMRDQASGIQMTIPTGAVDFDEYAPPFVKFGPVSDALPAQLLLLSQTGDEDRFFGLYEILQTLEIVPEEGERSRSSTSFRIEGIDATRHTYVEATRENGVIKGFILVWPAGDEDRRSRVLAEMRASFTRLDGVLDPAIAPPGEEQGIDLVSGLQIRLPRLTRSGFFIDAAGTVLTTDQVAQGCEELTLGGAFDARVVHTDAELGLAVLRPSSPLAPRRVAQFQTVVPLLRSEVAVAGFPFGGALTAPAISFGTLADIRGLGGEEQFKRVELVAAEGDIGGPLFDDSGAVLGMLLPDDVTGGGRIMPDNVSFAVDSDAIIASLRGAGIGVSTTSGQPAITPEMLTLQAAEMTVLVSCW